MSTEATLGPTTNIFRFDPPDLKRIRASAHACVGLCFFVGWLRGPFSEVLDRFSGRELFQYCFNIVPILFQYCSSIAPSSTVSMLFQYSSSTFSVLFQCCSKQFQYCSDTAPVLFQCCSNRVPVLFQYYTSCCTCFATVLLQLPA